MEISITLVEEPEKEEQTTTTQRVPSTQTIPRSGDSIFDFFR